MKNVMILTGAGQIGMAIARRMGYDMKIVIGDKKPENAQAISQIMNQAGFDTVAQEMDLSSRASIQALIAETQKHGPITMLVNAAGVSPQPGPHQGHPEGRSLWHCRSAGGGGQGHRPRRRGGHYLHSVRPPDEHPYSHRG